MNEPRPGLNPTTLPAVLLAILSLGATYWATPQNWSSAFAHAITPGDVIKLAPGRYPAWTFNTSGITYRSVNPRTASFAGISILPSARNLKFINLDVSGNPLVGVTVDGAQGTLLQGLSVHDNGAGGIIVDNGATGTTVAFSVVQRNGLTTRGPGVSIQSGASARVVANTVNGNGDYGILCWGCRDTEISYNKVSRNAQVIDWWHGGSEIGVGGYSTDGGLVRNVRVLNNTASHTPSFYGIYVLCSCSDRSQGYGVEIGWNTMSNNAGGPLAVARCDRLAFLSIHDNTPPDVQRQTCGR